MNGKYDPNEKMLEKTPAFLIDYISSGQITKEEFLVRGLVELVEALESEGIAGSSFEKRDARYQKVMIFIQENNPKFDISPYEKLYQVIVDSFNTGYKERSEEERGESITRIRDSIGPRSRRDSSREPTKPLV